MKEPPTLEYAHLPSQPKDRLADIAFACGLAPLILGSASFVIFGITRHEKAALVGIVTVVVGVVCTIVAAGCLYAHRRAFMRASESEWRRARTRRRRIVLLFVLDYALATIFIFAAIQMIPWP